MEIDQRWVVEHASDRQNYIDQAQSINLFFRPDCNVKYLHGVHFMAWKLGLKTLYYCRSEKIGKADKVAKKIEREAIKGLSMKALAAGETRTQAIVYGTTTCPYCERAKMVLTQKGYTYDFINLQELGKTAEEVTGRPVKTVPQIYIEGQYVGGFQEMMEYFNNQIVEDNECTACEG